MYRVVELRRDLEAAAAIGVERAANTDGESNDGRRGSRLNRSCPPARLCEGRRLCRSLLSARSG